MKREEVESIRTAAAEWIARGNAGPLSVSEQASLDAWLSADARHAAAYSELQDVWRVLNEPRQRGEAELAWSELERRTTRRRTLVRAVAGMAAAAALAMMVFPFRRDPAPAQSGPTIVVRPDARTLEDGSKIELNQGADIEVEFTRDFRRVTLRRGEALFKVVKDPARPFVVTVGAIEVRAVGTAFTVRREPDRIDVLVTEGMVAVASMQNPAAVGAAELAASPEPVRVGMGERAVVAETGAAAAAVEVSDVPSHEVAAALAWRDKRVEFNDTSLLEATMWFNQFNRVQVVLGDQSIANRLVTGVVWANDPEGFVRLVETGFKLRAERDGNVITLRRP